MAESKSTIPDAGVKAHAEHNGVVIPAAVLDRAEAVAEAAIGDALGRELIGWRIIECAANGDYEGAFDLVAEAVRGVDQIIGIDGNAYRISTITGATALTGPRARRALATVILASAGILSSPSFLMAAIQQKDVGTLLGIATGIATSDRLPELLGYIYAPVGEVYDLDMHEVYSAAVDSVLGMGQYVGALLRFFSVMELLRTAITIRGSFPKKPNDRSAAAVVEASANDEPTTTSDSEQPASDPAPDA